MAARFAEIYVLLGLKKQGFDKGVKSTQSSLKDMGKSFLTATAAIAGTGIAVYAAGKQLYEIGKRGAVVTQTAESFDLLSEKLALPPILLEELRTASRGTISDMDLMSSTATLLAGTTDELGNAMGNATPRLLEIAKAANKLNPSLGTTSFMYSSLAQGIKRSSPLILDNLGLTIKLGAANEAFAKKLGKSVDALTAEEKQIALLNATLEAGDRLIAQVGGSTESAADSFAILEASVSNLKDELAKGLSPAITDVVETGIEFIDNMNRQEAVLSAVQQAEADGIVTKEQSRRLQIEYIDGIKNESQALDKLNFYINTWRTEMGLADDQLVTLEGHERAYVDTTEDATEATEELKDATYGVNDALKEYSDRLLFNLASQNLDAKAAFELARTLGLVDERTVAAYEAVAFLTDKYDQNKDGVIDNTEATDGYIEAVDELSDSLNNTSSEMVISAGNAGRLGREIRNTGTRFTELRDIQGSVREALSGTSGSMQNMRDSAEAARAKAIELRNALDQLKDKTVTVTTRFIPGEPSKRQHGGPVFEKMPYIVGESGPELFIPNASGQIVPNYSLNTSLPISSVDRPQRRNSDIIYQRIGDINNYVQNTAEWAMYIEQQQQIEFDQIDQVL